ncbi:MAG: Flp pilus assembly complex ATPase component TadA [Firmicutes bacterium]|nr:Flp pilus assembly complex ATPase component TadA [Bacillota bacterium]
MSEFFNINDLIYSVNTGKKGNNQDGKSTTYKEVLDKVRHLISLNHSSELINVMYSDTAKDKLKNLIVRYLNHNKLSVDECDNISEVADRIYEDMAGFGALTRYISDTEVEEININSWNCIEVVYPDRVIMLPETFINAADCTDKIKKMVWLGGSIIDGSNPQVDSFIGEGIRISAVIPPCVDSKTGGAASIRRQKENVISRELMIKSGSATEDELDFLSLCINNGVSLAIAGSTGSGKTTDLGFLLKNIDDNKRIYTIEDTRELNIVKTDGNGKILNRVVHTVTKDGPNPISMDDLLKLSLRFHPYAIIPAEMRGKEALTAVEAGRTGHIIISTLHANSAIDAYNRILSMCVSTGVKLSEGKILEFILEAMPLILFKRQLPDGRRVYAEIFEGLKIENNRIKGNILYKYEIKENIYNEFGQIIKVVGEHKQINKMSEQLRSRLRYGGVSEEELRRFV